MPEKWIPPSYATAHRASTPWPGVSFAEERISGVAFLLIHACERTLPNYIASHRCLCENQDDEQNEEDLGEWAGAPNLPANHGRLRHFQWGGGSAGRNGYLQLQLQAGTAQGVENGGWQLGVG